MINPANICDKTEV